MNRISGLITALLLLFIVASCDKMRGLDEWGGYYDEKSGIYKIVDSRGIGGMKTPIDGAVSRFEGIFYAVENLSTVTMEIPNGEHYYTLAFSVYKGLKNDKYKQLTIYLDYVDPSLIPGGTSKFKGEWRSFVRSTIRDTLNGKKLYVEAIWNQKSGFFKGRIKFDLNGERVDYSEWLIVNGLSYLIRKSDDDPEEAKMLNLQTIPQQNKSGLWAYDFK